MTALKTTEEDDKEEVAEKEFKELSVDAVAEAVFIRTGWYFCTKRRKKKGTGRLFLVEKMFTLYSPTDFGKSFVASHTDSKNPPTAATRRQQVQKTPIGQPERDRKFVPSLFKFCFPFPNAFHGPFARWMHVINTKDLENAPSKVSGAECGAANLPLRLIYRNRSIII